MLICQSMAKKYFWLVFLILAASCVLADTYPKIDISGYKKWEYKKEDVQPLANYFLGLTYLGGFSPTVSGGPWQERLQLKILAQLSEKLSTTFDIEQQPETPERYDVKVNYDNKHELTFGDFTANFTGNEFATTTKYLNGVMVTSKDDGYDFITVPSAKLKSQIQGLTKQKGTNTKGPYSLGHGSILEGSERIELNGILQERGKDYIIDYFEGKITFNRILTSNDEFSYSYEYTNLLDLFFPALSKKDFFGTQGRFTLDPDTWGQKKPAPQPVNGTADESFPTVFTAPLSREAVTREAVVNEQAMEEESVGKYRLKNTPVQIFSENITFRGIQLKKNEDYNIKYDEGLITLLLPTLPTSLEPLQVTYQYPKTVPEQENLPGNGSRGPFALSHQNIISQSERVFINERLVVRDFDYYIDYDQGKIIFNYNISTTDNIKINYKYRYFELPPPPPPPKVPKKLTVGMTYLRESARKGESSAKADYVESFRAQDIIADNYTIYLSHFPILTSAEGGRLTVTLDGTELSPSLYAVPSTEVDPITGYTRVVPQATLSFINDRYDLSDGYFTGNIKILTLLEATSEVTVLYTYSKSVVGRFTGAGNGSRGPYYIRNMRNIVPGAERVDVWETGSQIITTYTRNSSFEPDAGNTGYSLNYNKDNPYITFNKELGTTMNFSIVFQYIAPSVPQGGDMVQDVTGMDMDFKLGDLLQFNGAYARSSNDRVIVSDSTAESYTTSTPTQTFTLLNKPVIENSEQVFVNNNLRNRDIDYAIDYTSGIIRFYSITIGTQDVVSVLYNFQSSGGLAAAGEPKSDNAYRYGIKTALGDASLSYNKKEIGFEYSPLGGTAIGVGSNYEDFGVSLKPSNAKKLFSGLTTNFSYKNTNNPLKNLKQSYNPYSRNYDRSYSLGVTPFEVGSINLDFRNYVTKGDNLNSRDGALTSDSFQNSFSGGVGLNTLSRGIFSFTPRYDKRLTLSRDNIASAESLTDYNHINASLSATDRMKFGYDWQNSQPTGKSKVGSTEEAISSQSITDDSSYDWSWDMTFGRIQKLSLYSKLINHESTNLIPTYSRIQTKNTTYHLDFNPVSPLTTSYDYNRQETPTVVVGGKNPKTERTSTNIKASPVTWLGLGWAYSEDNTINEAARESSGRANTYNADWTPVSLEKLKLSSNYNLYYRTALTPIGTLDSTAQDTTSFTQNYSMSIIPNTKIIITPGLVQENYQNRTVSTTATTETVLETVNRTIKCRVEFNPVDPLSLSGDYGIKVTSAQDINKQWVNKHKINLASRLGFRVFTWGEIVHNFDEEHNMGEVQAGGTFPDLDYLKSSNSYNFNFTVPWDNPVISSVVLSVGLKYVRFQNLLRASDNFDASLVTYEGTLNF